MLVRETKQNESFSWFSVKNNEVVCLLKVNKFQNEFLRSSFLLKYVPKIVRISALYSATLKSKNPYNFCSYLGRIDDFMNSF